MVYSQLEDEKVQCLLCHSLIKNGSLGVCRARKYIDELLYTEGYGKIEAEHFDPIEKKPLFHFYSGRKILSFRTMGCNLY